MPATSTVRSLPYATLLSFTRYVDRTGPAKATYVGGLRRQREAGGGFNPHGQLIKALKTDIQFRTDGTHLSDSCKLAIKPGDVISVDHTARTRVLNILAEYFRISAGFFLGARGDYRMNSGYSY